MTGRTAIVTGCAGFIGSHLTERLLCEGWRVIGIDAFTPYYDRGSKEENLSAAAADPSFELLETDLSGGRLVPVFRGTDVVFHLAAQAGVRASFGEGFSGYVRDNVLATQRVLEAARDAGCRRVVWASSSSVYGAAAAYPCMEAGTPTAPRSPYGVTKRACEDLADVYRAGGLETVGLRYFTVYGPRQRPDMALRRVCDALVHGQSFPLYGDGSQSRDFTHVADAVDATYRAARAQTPPPVLNVGGGHEATLAGAVAELESLAGRKLVIEQHPEQPGDVRRTSADTTLARRALGWMPAVGLREGLASELDWVRERSMAPVAA
jgi:UDP-glucuronate 4-epimerase